MAARATHLKPTAALADRVLLPGDPGRALQLARELLDRPLMFNHARGLWGYTGTAADGEPLTIQSTGIGGPSNAAITADLARLGVRTAVRIGTAWAGAGGPELGELVHVSAAAGADGTSRALGLQGSLATADPRLTHASARQISSADLLPDVHELPPGDVCDLSTAAFLAVAGRDGVAATAVVAIAHSPAGSLDEDGVVAAASALGTAASMLLGIPLRESEPLPPPREDEAA